VARLTLSSPDNGNLITAAMAGEIRLACQDIQDICDDEGLYLVLVTGAGACFSVGQDRPQAAVRDDATAQMDLVWINDRQVASALAALPMPVIVAINGDAFDHGLELALAGDIRIAVQQARFGFTGLAQGVLPWDGGTQRLPRLVGTAWARDMLLTGRVVDSTEALAMGLVNRVAPGEQVMAEAQRLAENIAAGGPVAARYLKEAVLKGIDLSLDQGLGLEADLNVILHSTNDRAEGIRSFLDRRPPRFSGS
jgi:enoyl-CoA hydratase/carnithine racemase